MTLKEQAAWWTGVAASILGGVGGLFVGAGLFILVMGLSPHDPADFTLATLGYVFSMFFGMLVGYVVAFSLWLALARKKMSARELLAVVGNSRFQTPAYARLNHRWVAWLLRLYRLEDETAA
jgi:hypothetical protein